MSKKSKQVKNTAVALHLPHSVYGDLTEKASESDRKWFEAHPESDERIRPYMAGEFRDEVPPTDHMVLVRQIRPGLRGRRAIPPDMVQLVKSGVHVFVPEFEKLEAMCK